MNVLRSPTGSDNKNERCASQPNLLNYGFSFNDSNLSQSINRQKRKQPDQDSEIKEELVEIRNKMDKLLDFMGQFTEAQKLAADKLSQDVASIKDQVNNFKVMADNLIVEQSTIKVELTELKVSTSTTSEKVESLQNEIENLKKRSTESRNNLSNITENTMIELRERIAREKNLIITGILESKNPDENKRQSDDTNAINNILKDIYKECPNPIKIFRLGNHKEGRCRPIKICFDSDEIPKIILRKKKSFKLGNTRIFSDKTKQQQTYIQNLNKELEQRVKNGEENLKIKYVKGIPKIVKSASKN